MKIQPPDDYVKICMLEYPTLCIGNTYDESKMLVLDHLFNNYGNGIRDDEEFVEHMEGYYNSHFKVSDFNPEKHLVDDIYWGYYDVKYINDKFKIGKGESISVFDSDRKDHANIVHWLKCHKAEFIPYPNFQQEYSLIYECPVFLTLGNDWLNTAIWFYENCLTWLKTNESKYHYAFPCNDEDTTKRRINDMEKALKKYNSNEEISEAYDCFYDGDVYDFEVRRWGIEREKIFRFINETIKLLKDNLN